MTGAVLPSGFSVITLRTSMPLDRFNLRKKVTEKASVTYDGPEVYDKLREKKRKVQNLSHHGKDLHMCKMALSF